MSRYLPSRVEHLVLGARVRPLTQCGQRDLAGEQRPREREDWPRRLKKMEEAKGHTGQGATLWFGAGLSDASLSQASGKKLSTQDFTLASFERESKNLTVSLN